MNLQCFYDESKSFSLVLFLQPETWKREKEEIERLGSMRHVRLVVQPCPYEGIEFLYRVAVEIPGHRTSLDKEVFWQAIELKKEIPPLEFEDISRHHFEYLAAILEQDAPKMLNERKVLTSLVRPYL